MAKRIRGEQVTVIATGPAGIEEGVANVASFDWELEMEILRSKFLGETADQFDDIFLGHTGSMELEISDSAVFLMQQRIQDRAQRRTPASTVFNITAAFALPNGTRVRLIFEDVSFGAQPLSVAGKDEYVTLGMDWGCSTMRRIL